MKNSPKTSILVVDDTPANLNLLTQMLGSLGYRTRPVPNGRLALQAVESDPPDIILLDINMPEMNGFTVCRRLKMSDKHAGIPVIFISALTETMDKVQAFTCGGVDYITKPFEIEEVAARIATHLELNRTREALRRHNEILEKTVAERTADLAEVNQRLVRVDRVKSDFLLMISHELRTPLNGLFGFSELAFEMDPKKAETSAIKKLYNRSRERIMQLLDDTLMLNQLSSEPEKFAIEEYSLSEIWSAAVCATGVKIQENVDMTDGIQEKLTGVNIHCHEDLMIRAFTILLELADKLSDRQPLAVDFHKGENGICLKIPFSGEHMSPKACESFFDISTEIRSCTKAEELGLSPVVADRIARLFEGKLSIQHTSPVQCELLWIHRLNNPPDLQLEEH